MTDQPPSPRPRVRVRVEPPEPPPGGPNAIPGVGGPGVAAVGIPLPRDPNPRANPATEHEVPAEIETGENTDTQATKGEAEPRPDQESPA